MLNNRLEQDRCGIRGRIRCLRGFKSHDTAYRFRREQGGLRNLRRRHNQIVSASPAASASQQAPALRSGSCRTPDLASSHEEHSENRLDGLQNWPPNHCQIRAGASADGSITVCRAAYPNDQRWEC